MAAGGDGEFDDWLSEGEGIVDDLRAAVHGELDPRTLDEAAVRHWQSYGRNMEMTARGMGVPGVTLVGPRRAARQHVG